MFDFVYSKIHPDEMKIYPCEIVPWTMIEKWYNEGKYNPYSNEDLFNLLVKVKEQVHPYIRISRIFRMARILGGGTRTFTKIRAFLLKYEPIFYLFS